MEKNIIMSEEKENLNKTNRWFHGMADTIGWLLLIQGAIMFQNGIIWMLTEDSDKWFSRIAIGFICLGFSGIIFRLRK